MSYKVIFSNSKRFLSLQSSSHTTIHRAALHSTPLAVCVTAACKALLKAMLLNLYRCFPWEKDWSQAVCSALATSTACPSVRGGTAEAQNLLRGQRAWKWPNSNDKKKISHAPCVWWADSSGGFWHFNWFLTQCRKKGADTLTDTGFSSSWFWGGIMLWAFHGLYDRWALWAPHRKALWHCI